MAARRSWCGDPRDRWWSDAFRSGPSPRTALPPNPAVETRHVSEGLEADDPNRRAQGDDVVVEVSGDGVPAPANGFEDVGLGKSVHRNVRWQPLQRYMIPVVLAGRDVMALTQPESGKTAALCRSIVSCLVAAASSGSGEGGGTNKGGRDRAAWPRALFLAPSIRVAQDIYEELYNFSHQNGLRIRLATLEYPITNQLHDLSMGADIIVTTPQRLMQLIERSGVCLMYITHLVIDEADMILDKGLEPQIRKILDEIDGRERHVRQTVISSASFPREVQRMAADLLTNYIMITARTVGTNAPPVLHRVEFISDEEKCANLLDLLKKQSVGGANIKQPLTLVLVETKRDILSLSYWLCEEGFPSTAIYADVTEKERQFVLKDFKSGRAPILVTTNRDLLGLDILIVAHTIHFDLPTSITEYTHRIGITESVVKTWSSTFFFNECNHFLAKHLLKLISEAKQDVPKWLEKYALYSPMLQPNYFVQHPVPTEVYDYIDRVSKEFPKREISHQEAAENARIWMANECLDAFMKYMEEHPHREETEFEFGELLRHCFIVENHEKVYSHYNFTVNVEHGKSESWNQMLYFAEVHLCEADPSMCCLLGPADEGHCYGRKNQGLYGLRHPAGSSYQQGQKDTFSPFIHDDEFDDNVAVSQPKVCKSQKDILLEECSDNDALESEIEDQRRAPANVFIDGAEGSEFCKLSKANEEQHVITPFPWRGLSRELLGPVRNQGRTSTCAFHSSLAATETLYIVDGAHDNPPRSFSIELSIADLQFQLTNYLESKSKLNDQSDKIKGRVLVENLFSTIVEYGVLGESRCTKLKVCVPFKIFSFQELFSHDTATVCRLLDEGKVMCGYFRISTNYHLVPPGETYTYDSDHPRMVDDGDKVHQAHVVMVVGFFPNEIIMQMLKDISPKSKEKKSEETC